MKTSASDSFSHPAPSPPFQTTDKGGSRFSGAQRRPDLPLAPSGQPGPGPQEPQEDRKPQEAVGQRLRLQPKRGPAPGVGVGDPGERLSYTRVKTGNRVTLKELPAALCVCV